MRQLQVSPGELDAEHFAALLRPAGQSVLHIQVEDRLRHLIRSGQVPVGADLPGELDLAAQLGLSRHTIRHALSTLVAEGLVRRERGRGTRVVDVLDRVQERRLDHFYAFAWEVNARGEEQRSHVLELAELNADEAVARRLGLENKAAVKRIVRVRTADGAPLVIETAYVPLALADGLDTDVLERGSIYDYFERRYQLRVTRAQETIRPIVLSRGRAGLLGVRPGSPAFEVDRTTWAETRAIEWQESTVRGDRFLYSVDLDRGPGFDRRQARGKPER